MHIDAYTIKNKEQFFELGIEEMLENGFCVFVEWGDLFENEIKNYNAKIMKIYLSTEGGVRYILIKNDF
jgi:tRNA threonylcarbamoyladenosine biosynthesis protein TsaE